MWYYYHYDGLGSVVALSKFNSVSGYAELVERYEYSAFGQTTVTLNGSTGNPYRFTGRDWDAATGIYYYRARFYKPDIGRFLQPDPISYEDGPNMYTYCGNSYTFTGRQLDTLDNGNLKIMYYRHRYYSPSMGRFYQHDPIGYIAGINLYEYVTNNPNIMLDPYGLLGGAQKTCCLIDKTRNEECVKEAQKQLEAALQKARQKYEENMRKTEDLADQMIKQCEEDWKYNPLMKATCIESVKTIVGTARKIHLAVRVGEEEAAMIVYNVTLALCLQPENKTIPTYQSCPDGYRECGTICW